MQNITADAYLEPFPHLIFHNFYDDKELALIWEELEFYTKPDKLFDGFSKRICVPLSTSSGKIKYIYIILFMIYLIYFFVCIIHSA